MQVCHPIFTSRNMVTPNSQNLSVMEISYNKVTCGLDGKVPDIAAESPV